jgi:hypothetical protein
VGTDPGDGTPGNPFKVGTVAQLQKVGTETAAGGWTLSAHYIQTANINLSGVIWTPIGASANRFSGVYDGGGYSISNLNINNAAVDGQGLFGHKSGTVRNVALVNATVKGNSYVGGIAAYNSSGIIENCYVTGSIEGNLNNVGGIAGYNLGTVQNCYTTCSVSASNDRAGGIVGYNISGGKVQYCYATGSVIAWDAAGGVIGFASSESQKTTNCVALNPSVKITKNYTPRSLQRVVGEITQFTTPSDLVGNNYGRTDMVLNINNAAGNVAPVSNLNGLDGADVATATAVNTWWTSTAGFSTANWTTRAGALPILKTTTGATFNQTQNPTLQ